MDDVLSLAGILGFAVVAAAIALVAARILRIDHLLRRTPAGIIRAEPLVGAAGFSGLLGALFLLFGGAPAVGLSDGAVLLLVLACVGAVAFALRPETGVSTGVGTQRNESRRSRAA